ncbi:uncharacterized protein EKO05_0001387 [Ascochyta rabiei]|uniref:uncharacterized protein n=1 Tax=Didymella rabiei TaxID=5454 RepID=UPI002204AB2B|nr:uncharacterized protein EKO05_0001387 [Ascochyta rabiei]UPX10746.1 hypothetical protein EKO05_0001387 [Ascochyta rabiei]
MPESLYDMKASVTGQLKYRGCLEDYDLSLEVWFRWAREELQFAKEMRRAAAEGKIVVKDAEYIGLAGLVMDRAQHGQEANDDGTARDAAVYANRDQRLLSGV